MVRIHGYLVSTWTRTVCMTCVEKGIDYELVPLAYGSAEHAQLHPFARMPAVEIDGRVRFESLAITLHLDESRPGVALQPADAEGRFRMRTWMSVCSDYLFREVVRLIPRRRPPTDEEFQTARTQLERAERLVGDGPFLAGDAVSLADLYLAPQLSGAREKAPAVLDGLDALNAFLARMETRASFTRTRYDPAQA